MALIFPNNPTLDQTYQSGSSAKYLYNGKHWEVITPPSQIFPSALNATSASYSLNSSNTISSSFATTASAFLGTTPYYLTVRKNSTAQSIPYNSITTVTNWDTPELETVTGAWNGTTGIFTVPRTGNYQIYTHFMPSQTTATVGQEWTTVITRDAGFFITQGEYWAETTASIYRPTVPASCIYPLTVGQTVKVQIYQNLDGANAKNLYLGRNLLTIQELPNKIQR